jgi:serine phosphatase RsbU (regulator of sigma subunit)
MPSEQQQRIAELTTLNALAQTLNQAYDLRGALDNALKHIVELMGLQTGWIFLHDESGAFSLAARHLLPPAIAYPGSAWINDCACQELCVAGKLDKAVNMVHCSRLRGAVGDKCGLAQHASVPLRSGDELLGILNVATTQWGRIGPARLQLLSAAGLFLGTAIARARLYDQVKVRRVQEQAALLNLSQELLVAEALESALQRLVRVGTRLLEADAVAFIEADEPAGRALLRAAHGWKLPQDCAWPVVLDPYVPHLWYLPENSNDLAADVMDVLPPLLRDQGFQGHLSIAVEIAGVPVGTLMANTHNARQFLDDEAQLLGLLATQLVQTLERERLHQEALARQRLEQELDFARDIQFSFLPDRFPQLPGYTIAAYYRAARQVGGDFYDFIELRDESAPPPEDALSTFGARRSEFRRTGRRYGIGGQAVRTPASKLGIVIADVTDKGVPAALFMALSRTVIRATASDGRAPVEVLERANRLILADAGAGLFVTCFYALVDSRNDELVYANGGHNYPLLYRAATGDIEQLRAQGIVLGVVAQPVFEQRRLQMAAGDVLLFYTDGVTEAMNRERELFGEERLSEVLQQVHQHEPESMVQAILDALADFTNGEAQSDDITMVVLKKL